MCLCARVRVCVYGRMNKKKLSALALGATLNLLSVGLFLAEFLYIFIYLYLCVCLWRARVCVCACVRVRVACMQIHTLGAATIEFAFCRFIFLLRPPALSDGNVCVRV